MKPTIRIAARHALSAGLATSAWRTQRGSLQSSLMQAAGPIGNSGNSGNGGNASNGRNSCGGKRSISQPCAYIGAGFGNAPRHEIDTPIYREVAM